MNTAFKFPFFAKASIFCVGLYAFIAMLYIAQTIILPLLFSIIIATVLHPVVNFFVELKINRVLAIALTLLLTITIIGAFGVFFYSQASKFSESWPILVEKFTQIFNQTIHWAHGYFDISSHKINVWIAQTRSDLLNSGQAAIGPTIMSVGSALVAIFLVPVYVFFILLYQPLLIDVIRKLFINGNQDQVAEVVTQTKTVVQHYLIGLLIEAALVAGLNIIGLWILGIQYAILLGILAALLNIIPYIGGLVAVALLMIIALVTKDSAMFALYVLGIHLFVQLIDNNYIVPKIVASKVKINALVSIFVVLAGGALWGIPGMFLSIPLTAIVKVLFDHIDSLKPIGLLLGDTMPALAVFKTKRTKKKE